MEVEKVQQCKEFPDKGLPELPVKEHGGVIPSFPPYQIFSGKKKDGRSIGEMLQVYKKQSVLLIYHPIPLQALSGQFTS